jgi:molybdopterin-guanine dinucleotide biosynthesis protein MobB
MTARQQRVSRKDAKTLRTATAVVATARQRQRVSCKAAKSQEEARLVSSNQSRFFLCDFAPLREPVVSCRPALLAVCGHSGSGKTTLIEAAARRLRRRGLTVAVVKHDVHGLDVDRRGKDSDRLFRSGADVFLHGPRERLARLHSGDFAELLRRYDLVLVEGWKRAPLPKVWLLGPGETNAPRGVGNILAVLPRGVKRLEAFMAILDGRLARKRRSVNDE